MLVEVRAMWLGGGPKPASLRVGKRQYPAFWEALSEAGVPTTVVRWPITFPAEDVHGRVLSGLGAPDLRGGLGSYTFYSTREPAKGEEGREKVIVVQLRGGVASTFIPGPDVAGLTGSSQSRVPLAIRVHRDAGRVTLTVGGQSKELAVGEWSGFLRLRFKTGALSHVAGTAAFHLTAVTPHLQLYLSPVQVDPSDPAHLICSPSGYAAQLADAIGPFHTLGMPEDTKAVTEGRIDLDAFLHLCDRINGERERMLAHELGRFEDGLLALVADTTDRLQHMFWVTRDPRHPRHDAALAAKYRHVIPDTYRYADRLVGHVLDRADGATRVLVVSDHGFGPYRRSVHLNSWLADRGLLFRRDGPEDPEGGALFRGVLWEQTSAYAFGFGGIYVNLAGREGKGVIGPGVEQRTVCEQIASSLRDLRDPATGERPVRRVYFRDELYHGPLAPEGPDLVVGLKPGYRVSWQTALGGAPQGLFGDNRQLWSGDHIVDPHYVPGALFASFPLRAPSYRQTDVAPTALQAFGLPKSPIMAGRALL